MKTPRRRVIYSYSKVVSAQPAKHSDRKQALLMYVLFVHRLYMAAEANIVIRPAAGKCAGATWRIKHFLLFLFRLLAATLGSAALTTHNDGSARRHGPRECFMSTG